MEDIFFSGTPLLESVGEYEPQVVELREVISHAIKKSLVPLIAYSRLYKRYLELQNLNIPDYVRLVIDSLIFLVKVR